MSDPPQATPLTNKVPPQQETPAPPPRVGTPDATPEAKYAPPLRVDPPENI